MAERSSPRNSRETTRFVALALTVVVLLGLLLDNSQSVRIGYVVGDVRMPLLVALALAAALGAAVDRLLVWRTGRAQTSRVKPQMMSQMRPQMMSQIRPQRGATAHCPQPLRAWRRRAPSSCTAGGWSSAAPS